MQNPNPFDKGISNDKFVFFNDMTKAINEWMIKKYPLFDVSLENKIKDLERHSLYALDIVKQFNEKIEEEKKTTLTYFKNEINKFLDENHPGVASKLYILSEDLDKLSKKLNIKDKQIEKKLSTLMRSDSLCEDVYKMRDEMKVLKKEWQEFSNKLKMMFK